MEPGDLLLVDAAANYEYLTGDITRTYPVSGTFTPEQRDIYELVLAAQEAGIKAARAGVRAKDVQRGHRDVIKAACSSSGSSPMPRGDQYRTWYTHGPVHYIGMDVHDVGDYERPLEPGIRFVIEPGSTSARRRSTTLPRHGREPRVHREGAAGGARFEDIGVRIEDSFLIAEQGLGPLGSVSRTVQEVEAHLAR